MGERSAAFRHISVCGQNRGVKGARPSFTSRFVAKTKGRKDRGLPSPLGLQPKPRGERTAAFLTESGPAGKAGLTGYLRYKSRVGGSRGGLPYVYVHMCMRLYSSTPVRYLKGQPATKAERKAKAENKKQRAKNKTSRKQKQKTKTSNN